VALDMHWILHLLQAAPLLNNLSIQVCTVYKQHILSLVYLKIRACLDLGQFRFRRMLAVSRPMRVKKIGCCFDRSIKIMCSAIIPSHLTWSGSFFCCQAVSGTRPSPQLSCMHVFSVAALRG
jgi:hypothetical protein